MSSSNSFPGLEPALRLYQSDKIKDRSEGQTLIRQLFSNKENLIRFQESASRSGGQGWIAFYQCLFQVVILEKKVCLRKSVNPQAERRLAEAISLVRWMVERSVHLIGRKPFLALTTHMTHLLVYAHRIFPPAALDYAKALRSLLSYPPHLENLDQQSWKALMGICWAAVLGDSISIDNGWEDELEDSQEDQLAQSTLPPSSTQGRFPTNKGKASVTQATTELVSLIPILLSSTNTPLVPPLPIAGTYAYEPSLGFSILTKIQRYFSLYQVETASHLSVLRSLNLVLAQMELNCRVDFVTGGMKVLPHLVQLWPNRSKGIREQVQIALRILLPYLVHKSTLDKDNLGTVRSSLETLLETMPKETMSRGGVEPLDLATVRLRLSSQARTMTERVDVPYETLVMTAGFDFSHESAFRWSAIELYSEVIFHLYNTVDLFHVSTPSRESTQAKRRKLSDPFANLLSGTTHGATLNRQLHLQVLLFLMDRHWSDLHHEARVDIGQRILGLLDEDEGPLQMWAFVAAATLACLPKDESTPSLATPMMSAQHQAVSESADRQKMWNHSMRKVSIPSVSRAAAIASVALLQSGQLDMTTATGDIGTFLETIDIQGPAYPFDSVCAFLDSAICLARQDVRLYTMKLEDKLVSWISKWNAPAGSSGKGRLDQHTPSDLLPLLSSICHLRPYHLEPPATVHFLPECALVDHILEHHRTRPIRQFTLYGRIPAISPAKQDSTAETPIPAVSVDSEVFLEGNSRRVCDILSRSLSEIHSDWPMVKSGPDARPAIAPDRCRRAMDLVVLSTAFLGALQANGLRPDSTLLQNVTKLIDVLHPVIRSSSYDIAALDLMWRGLEPMVHRQLQNASPWPVLLKPTSQSGIRDDLLQKTKEIETVVSDNPLLHHIWTLPGLHAAFRPLCDSCIDLLGGVSQSQTSSGTQYPVMEVDDDDDFGEIRNAETDAMPSSKESVDCQRITASFLDLLATIRLRSTALASAKKNPPKDAALVNSFLLLDGARMVALGHTICHCLKHGLLRLGAEAVDLVFERIEEMVQSYAYSRDEGMLRLALDFFTFSAETWLSIGDDSDLPIAIMGQALQLSHKARKGHLTSWRVRLALLSFVDEYLDYDPEFTLWKNASRNDMEVDGASGPTDVISDALVDPDMRVRFRAATSTAGLLYLPSFPSEVHLASYNELVESLPRAIKHWDSFITDILWKLNCCIPSPNLRTAAIYHLYEIPIASPDYNVHLLSGLETVSQRLGLEGIAPLYLAHAPLIISSQIDAGQSPMRISPQLYGFKTPKAYATAVLATTASAVFLSLLASKTRTGADARKLEDDANGALLALCDAAGCEVAQVISEHMPVMAAWALTESTWTQFGDPNRFDRDQILEALSALGDTDGDLVKEHIDATVSQVIALLDLSSSQSDLIRTLDEYDTENRPGEKAYSRMMTPHHPQVSSVLDPRASITDVLDTIAFLHKRYPGKADGTGKADDTKILFNVCHHLFYQINKSFLVNEQVRGLRSVAIAVSLQAHLLDNKKHSLDAPKPILSLLLRELVPLLAQKGVQQYALQMLSFVLKIAVRHTVPPGLDLIMLNLPNIPMEIDSTPVQYDGDDFSETSFKAEFDKWFIPRISIWDTQTNMSKVMELAKLAWPTEYSSHMTATAVPSPGTLASLTKRTEIARALADCRAISDVIKQSTGEYRERALYQFRSAIFWDIKPYFGSTGGHQGSVKHDYTPFLDTLSAVHGQVQLPGLNTFIENTQLRPLRKRPHEDPLPLLQAAIIEKIVLKVSSASYESRFAALQVLRSLIPVLKDSQRRHCSPATTDLLEILVPTTPPTWIDKTASAKELISDDTWLRRSKDAAQWCSGLATLLCKVMGKKDSFFTRLVVLFETIDDAAEELLPLLVQSSLSIWLSGSGKNSAEKNELKDRQHSLSVYFTKVLQYPSASVETVKAVIDIMLHLRNYHPPYRTDELGYEAWLDIDHLLLSQSALKCGSFATSLMFLDLSRDDLTGEAKIKLTDQRVQNIMYETYSNVDDPDGFYGIKNLDVRDALNRRLQHEGEHHRSLGLHAAALESGLQSISGRSNALLVMRDMHHLGFNQLSNAVFGQVKSVDQQNASTPSDPLIFELAWRTGDWDLPLPKGDDVSSEARLYAALRAVHLERDPNAAAVIVQEGIGAEVARLKDLGMERTGQVKKAVVDLLCLREVDRWLTLGTSANGTDPSQMTYLTELDSAYSFNEAERLLATRRSLIGSAKTRESQTLIGDLVSPNMEKLVALESQCLIRLGRLARSEGNVQAALNAVVAAQHVESGLTPSDAVADEFSHVLWAQDEHSLAIQHVQQMIDGIDRKKKTSGTRLAVLLSRTACWTSKAKLRAPNDVSELFEEAKILSEKHKIASDQQSQLCFDYAVFADDHQMTLSKSPELERLANYRRAAEQQAAELAATPTQGGKKGTVKRAARSSSLTMAQYQAQKEMREEREALEGVMSERKQFASTALRMYASALALSDRHDDSATRMVSLWLECDQDDDINEGFRGSLLNVPSHKFVFLNPQLTARLDEPKETKPFNTTLNTLVLRISQQHPFHILYQVITLSDGTDTPGNSRKVVKANLKGRTRAAASILATISTDEKNNFARTACKEMKLLAQIAIRWCQDTTGVEMKLDTNKEVSIPANASLKKLENLSIPVPTRPPPVSVEGKYERIATLARYRVTYALLGGISRPKKMQVVDSNGVTYKEIFKGNDELRQDAVMEQVFELSNKLLSRDRRTKDRKLCYRTYMVVPLAQQTGIMEFVGNSTAIGDWLKPAHHRYGTANGDIDGSKIRDAIGPIQKADHTAKEITPMYAKFMTRVRPVMRHFFTERHRNPLGWFTMRLNYTRSAAVTSIVGWVLGVGDRHCSNILIDTKSGEVIHIDFGIVFEKGFQLRIPEKVPFRLTKDTVDGFGLTGVDGTFRRCSEHTLRVLRESSELITTVLEVFKHDPLYEWDADPKKVEQVQGGEPVPPTTSASALEKADRILAKIKSKLRGDLSVEYTVNQLIQEARDMDNLARIFVGWQPWY